MVGVPLVLDRTRRLEWTGAVRIRTEPWPPGVPCWIDLATSDVDGAVAFYSSVLGWEVDPEPAPTGYRICHRGGAAAAAIGPVRGDAPVAWTLYVASDDADATATAVRDGGGTVVVEPFDVGTLGRLLVAADPQGAVVGVWQGGEHIGASLVNEPGGLVWDDLHVPEPDAVRPFYAGVFGWTYDVLEAAGPGYTTFTLDGERAPLGGIGPALDGVPAHWQHFLAVKDADAVVTAAEAAGGEIVVPATDSDFGRQAVLADPYGAVFSIIETDGSDQPQR